VSCVKAALVYKISGEKTPHFTFLWAGLGELGPSLFPSTNWRKVIWLSGLGFNSATCYICVKLKFWVTWAQKDPTKITISSPVRVRNFEKAWFRASH
jgi:hypothetical protein